MIPDYIHPFLWSYDITALDERKHKKRIITNVLNLGTKKATDWLFNHYSLKDIRNVVQDPLPGEWSSKSLHYWALIFGIKESQSKRKIN